MPAQTIYVYAGWQTENPQIGTLTSESVKGRELFSFEYHPDWLPNRQVINLDPDLQLFAGQQFVRGENYGENITYSGPMYKAQVIRGNKIELEFTHTDGGTVAKGDTLKGFTIAGADKKFHPAQAIISGNKVIESNADVSNPVAVRYAWANNPVCNFYNKANLPASPFRTDDWYDVR
jgi:hypothetical protein